MYKNAKHTADMQDIVKHHEQDLSR